MNRKSSINRRARPQETDAENRAPRPPRSGEDYVYLRKYRGTCAPDIAELMKHDQTKTSVRCLVTAHDDYAQPTEEELEAVPPPEGEPEEGAPEAPCKP